MGLFDIFNKNKGNLNKKEEHVGECFSLTGELLSQISDLALRYSVDDNLLETYSRESLDIEFLNKARAELEFELIKLGKNLGEYYNNEYYDVSNTAEGNKNFSYSLDALGVLFNNSLDLYTEDEGIRNNLNYAYDKCNKELVKVKDILSDDKTLQEFTGIIPIVEETIEEPVDIIEEETKEEAVQDIVITEKNEDNNEADAVDGDLILNTDKMKVYFIRISRNEEEELNLNLCIENNLDKEAVVRIKDVSVDGILTEPVFSCNIMAKSRIYDKAVFKNDIQQLVNFEGTFYITENNSDEIIDEYKVSMFKED